MESRKLFSDFFTSSSTARTPLLVSSDEIDAQEKLHNKYNMDMEEKDLPDDTKVLFSENPLKYIWYNFIQPLLKRLLMKSNERLT